MIKEHKRVVLTTAILAEGLEKGDVGTVVHACHLLHSAINFCKLFK